MTIALLTADAGGTPPPRDNAPPAPHGPMLADADKDGQVSRAEMIAWLQTRFADKDRDGDGRIPVRALTEAMTADAEKDAPRGHKRGGERPGPGMGGAGMSDGGMIGDGRGGPPPGSDTMARTGAAHGGMRPAPPPRGMPIPEDSNDDGMIDQTEYMAPALEMFDRMDANHDGMLSHEELPPPPPDGPPPGD